MMYGIYKKIFLIFSETLSKYGFAYAYKLPSHIHPSIVFSDAKGRSVQIGYDFENDSPFGRLYGEKAEGYRFSYRIDDVELSAETILFKLEKTIFTGTFASRRENRETDRELIDRIIAGITLE